MGLDMYLKKRIYVGNKYREKARLVRVIVPEDQEDVMFPTSKIKDERISEITEDVGYWRKANAVHKWFVDNVQEGEDDCGIYDVSGEQLKELLDVVLKIIADPKLAPKLLPTQEGFFFGGTEYDEYYMRDLQSTKQMLEEILAEDPNAEYQYHSSW